MRTSIFSLIYGSTALGIVVFIITLFMSISYALHEDDWRSFGEDVYEVKRFLEETCEPSGLTQCINSKYIPFDFEYSFNLAEPAFPDDEEYHEMYGILITELEEDGYKANVPLSFPAIDDPLWVIVQDLPENMLPEDPEEFDDLDMVISGVLLGLILLIPGLGIFLYFPVRRINRWVSEVQHASNQIAQNNYDVKLPSTRIQPLGDLNSSFNAMADRIQAQIRDQHILANAIAHELRTPLMRYRLALGLLKRSASDNQKELMENLESYTDELEQITSDTLQLATLRDGGVSAETVDLKSFMEKRIQKYETTFPHLVFHLMAPQREITTDTRYLQLALDNLLSNACRYTQSVVKVDCQFIRKRILISVSDDGEGIPQDMLEHVLKPFTRLDKSRSRDTGGAGLGLAIVNVAVQRLGGEIQIQSSAQGTQMTLNLPCQR